jgi:lipopolysaccharide export system protein LptA
MRFYLFLFIFFIFSIGLCAQNIAPSDSIRLVRADSLIGVQKEGIPYNTLVGNVILEQKGTTLNCDSAHLFIESNYVEAFGNVSILASNGATVHCDYLRYNGNTHIAFLKNNVSIVDGTNTLQSEELTYNVITKIATYNNGATLQADNTTLNSNTGIYNGKTKDAYFKGDVLVTDPKFTVNSRELKYNTEKKYTTFLDESTINIDNTTIYGKRGTYDSKKEEGLFTTRSSVINDKDNQEIIADHLFYNKKTGIQTANGHVVINDNKENRRLLADKVYNNEITTIMKAEGNVEIDEFKDGRVIYAAYAQYTKRNKYMMAQKKVLIFDSAQNTILNCDKIEYNLDKYLMLATGKPLLRTLADKDSLFIKADSFFSAPSNVIDSIKNKLVPNVIVLDSNKQTDSTVLRTLLGIGHVKMYGDSMQAVCDSLSYSQQDSTFRLFKAPVLWTSGSQATGDTINIITENNKAKQLAIIKNAMIVNDTKDKSLYDQISGTRIDGYMDSSQLKEMFCDGNAESIYYNKNEKNEYLGQNKSKSAQLRIIMKAKKINKIIFYSDPEGEFAPLDKMPDAQKYLPNFKWLESLRPKNKLELIDN